MTDIEMTRLCAKAAGYTVRTDREDGIWREVFRRDVTGSVHCKVQHFCGDFWPVEPCLRMVDILERTYEEAVS